MAGGSHSDFFLQTHAVAILFTTELPCIAVPSVNIEVIVSIDKNKRYEEDPSRTLPNGTLAHLSIFHTSASMVILKRKVKPFCCLNACGERSGNWKDRQMYIRMY